MNMDANGQSITSLAAFRQELQVIAGYSTIGINTMAGVSPKNAGLEQLARRLGDLPSAAEQVTAVQDVLDEAATLWPDQEAHVISNLARDAVAGESLVLHPDARSPIAEAVLRAAIKVAPQLGTEGLVSDSLALDVLRAFSGLMANHADFAISRDIRDAMVAAGLFSPASTAGDADSPDTDAGRAVRFAADLAAAAQDQITPPQLAAFCERAAALPEVLRGRSLALLVSTFWNTMNLPENAPEIAKIGQLVDALPPRHRLTSLEATYNQLNILPAEQARRLTAGLVTRVQSLPQDSDMRFNRSRSDLLLTVQRQKQLLESLPFEPEESLAECYQRDPALF